MNTSTDKILSAATECFFQHGYHTANISMISRVSRVSRVTIHKQFSSKEQLFHFVVKSYIEKNEHYLNSYKEADGEFWLLTKTLIINNCQEVFSDISSAQIRADLIQAANQHCKTLIDGKRNDVSHAIEEKLNQAIENNALTLTNVNLKAAEFAHNIETIFFGIMSTNVESDVPTLIEQTMAIYQASTQIS